MRDKRFAAAIAAVLAASWTAAAAGGPELEYVAIVSRHGVRAPTWDAARLNRYSADPWPTWDVPPGNLTLHGRLLMQLMGAYYREWLAGQHLLHAEGCQDARRVFIRADKDQRTVETARALAESLLPGCAVAVHSQPESETDPLFSGVGRPDPERARQAVMERLGADPQTLLVEHRAALDALQHILNGPPAPSTPIGVSVKEAAVELQGPFATGSTLSENLLLEYTNGMRGAALGWGRLTPQNLHLALELHAVYADLMRRTAYLARVRGSNLLQHVLRSLDQAASGKSTPGALGQPGDALLILSAHDTNLSNLSGMLGLSWRLPGYQPDDTPPGGALIFSLWRAEGGRHFLTLRYVAQTLDQMRDAQPLSVAAGPAGQDVPLPGCPAASDVGCPWDTARAVIQKAIDPQFVAR